MCPDRPIVFESDQGMTIAFGIKAASKHPMPPKLESQIKQDQAISEFSMALDLSPNTVATLLHHLWASGQLEELIRQHWLGRIENDKILSRLLSLRIQDASLSAPPTPVFDQDGHLVVSSAMSLQLKDGDIQTPAHLFARVRIVLSAKDNRLVHGVELLDLELSCEPSPGHLVPCFSTIVSEIRKKAPEFSDTFATLLSSSLMNVLNQQEFEIDGLGKFELQNVSASPGGNGLRFEAKGAFE
jgi:hypothetical protein